jgi:hypothetical protein
MATSHEFFGVMELDEQNRIYRASIDFALGHKVSVTIDWMGISPIEALKRSRDIYDMIRVREPEYRNKIAQSLLRLYNDNWRNGEMLDTDGFMRRISLLNVNISPADFGVESCVTLYYTDGDLFAGHYIEVALDAALNYIKSQLAG